jgi:hypothetical protein
MGHAVSRRYLTAWLRELVGSYDGDREIAVAWEQRLGVTLPDPAIHDVRRTSPGGLPHVGTIDRDDSRSRADTRERPLDLSDEDLARRVAGLVEGCEPPPDLPSAYRNRTTLRRTAIEAVLPEPGESTIPGRAQLTFTILLQAVRYTLVHHREVIPHEVCIDLDQPAGDLPRAEWLIDAEARAASTVAGRGIPSGTTPGRLADREAAIERYRAASAPHGDGLRYGRGGVVIDSPPAGFVPGGPAQPGEPAVPGRPGEPEVPIRPGRPELPERDGVPSVVCEPPHCEWFSGVVDSVLATYLHAEVRVEADLTFGFSPSGAMWLPQLDLAVTGEPQLTTVTLDTAGPLDDVDLTTVEEFVHTLVRRNTAALLAEATVEHPLPTTRPLVPAEASYLGAPQVILDLLTFQQSGGGPPNFTIDGDQVYWPVEAVEQLTGHLA